MAPIEFYVLVLSPQYIELFGNFSKYSLIGGTSLGEVLEVSKASFCARRALRLLLIV